MFVKRRDPHHRPAIKTPEQAVAWLEGWSDEHFVGDDVLPQRPWRRTSPRELESVADSLLKARATFDANGRRSP
jgi:hypothetical protein